MAKTDKELGDLISAYLVKEGIETPIHQKRTTDSFQLREIKESFEKIMILLNLDLKDDSLADTPLRVAKMFINELFYGLNYENFPKCTVVQNKLGKYTQPVKTAKIPVISTCEHHFQTISGYAEIEYLPGNWILGLSKFNRIVDFFSRRPQIQERLTAQIGATLTFILGTTDVKVHISAAHGCIKCRGVNQDGCLTETSFKSGMYV